MADTTRTRAALVALLADNVSGDISAQDIRDFLASVAVMSSGAGEPTTPPSSRFEFYWDVSADVVYRARFEGTTAEWEALESKAFITIVELAVNQSHTAWGFVSWDTVVQDDLGAFSETESATYLTVPEGATRARVTVKLAWGNVTSTGRYARIVVLNDDTSLSEYTDLGGDIRTARNEAFSTIQTTWYDVIPGQKIALYVNSDGAAAPVSGTGFGGRSRMQVEWKK